MSISKSLKKKRPGVPARLVAVTVILAVVVGLIVFHPWTSSRSNSIDRFNTEIAAGLTAMQNNDVEAARKAFTNAIKIDPTSAVAHYDLGVLVLQYDANPNAAVDLFSTTLELDPNFTNARYNRALAYKSMAMFDEAVTDLRAVLAAKPDDANVMKKLGEMLVQTGKLEEGTALLERAYELDPNLK